jgi:hypothetical protein
LARVNTDAADSCALDVDAKCHVASFRHGSLQEFVGVLDGVRMWEHIAYSQPDFAIVRMSGQRLGIIQLPWTDDAFLKRKLHGDLIATQGWVRTP